MFRLSYTSMSASDRPAASPSQSSIQQGLLPLQQALGLQDAFRHLHPDAREFTRTATSGASSARIDRWLVSDSLLQQSAQPQLQTSGRQTTMVSLCRSAAPLGPGVWAMPANITTHPAFKTIMTAQIEAFMLACPVSSQQGS